MPLLAKFNEIIQGKYPFLKGADLYVAVSGGKDSMTLSHLLKRSGLDHTILHCNFCLRGNESDEDEQFVRQYCEDQGLTFECKRFDTEGYAEEQGLSIQVAARNLRYNWFHTFLENENSFLLTAHHLDDSIETFFINLLRGTGFKGLAGIPEIKDQIVRPLSSFEVGEIIEYLRDNDLEYRHDSSNDSDKYLRNRIRNHLIPELLDIEPALKKKMHSFFDEMQDLKDMLQADATDFKKKHFRPENNIEKVSLDVLQEVEYRHQLISIFGEYGIRPNNAELLRDLIQNRNTGKELSTSTHLFIIDRDDLLIQVKERTQQKVDISIDEFPFEKDLAQEKISIEESQSLRIDGAPETLKLDKNKIQLPLTLRNWQQGDRIQPLGMEGSKLISDILIDKKIDRLSKNNILVIEDSEGNILCIPGMMISEGVRIDRDTVGVLEVCWGN